MYASSTIAEGIVERAVTAVGRGGADLVAALDALQAPIYVTDAKGVVTYFNATCVGFAGRLPAVGKDRWCVTWKLYTEDGVFLPHDECPMAVAIKTKTAVRGVTAIAERPDGARVTFMPFPTPVIGPTGELLGAVNLLIDVTEVRQIAELRNQARKCRQLALGIGDRRTVDTLNAMALEYDAKAVELEAAAQGSTANA